MDINTQIDMISKNSLHSFYYTSELNNDHIVNLINALKNNSTMVGFTLSFAYNFSDNIIDLINPLSTNPHLKNLDISCNNLGDNTIIKICDMFQHHKSIECIAITYNMLSQLGIDALARLLHENKNINEISFGENNLYSLNIYPIFDNLSFNNNLKTLSILLGILNRNDVKSLASLIRKNKTDLTLELCVLECCYIIDEMAILLTENVNITQLTLTNPSDDDVDTICKSLICNTKLNKLQLHDGSITNIGALKLAELLCTNTTIKILSLENNNIGAKGVIALCNNSSLKELNVYFNPNMNKLLHIQSLSHILCENTTLECFYLCCSNFDFDRKSWNCFINSIQENYTITDFGYSTNNLTDEIIKFIERNKMNNTNTRFIKTKPIVD